MPKKENTEVVDDNEPLEISEIIEPDNEFDLSVLKSDIENAEREAKELLQQELIDRADFQKDSENFQEKNGEPQDFDDWLIEFLEFLFSFVNRSLEKLDVSKLDKEFITEFVENLRKILPKGYIDKIQSVLDTEGKVDSSKRLFRIAKFIMFISREIYKRYDEYSLYREVQGKGKLFSKIKTKEPEQ